jgi:addiction module RelE/StbE family toxin
MHAKIRWSPRAVSNIEEIYEYIAKDSKNYANVFITNILTLVKGIPDFPNKGRIVPEYIDKNLRELIYKNYRIVYRIKNDIIEIVAICHGSKPL